MFYIWFGFFVFIFIVWFDVDGGVWDGVLIIVYWFVGSFVVIDYIGKEKV